MRKVVVAALCGVALAACADSDRSGTDESAVAVRLVIPDFNIREPGVSCAGASAFRFAHPDAEYTIENPSGTTVSTGTLPQGVAEKAFTIDIGDERQPTVCVMSLDVPGVRSVEGHTLVIADHSPVSIVPNPNLDDIPEAVLS